MIEPVIRDASFIGSPLMSYGEAPAKKRLPKLLALLAGSFAVLLIILCAWFWFLTSLPLPAEPAILAIVPAQASLPDQSPEVWQQAVRVNSPLPTVLGFVRSPSEQNRLVPFAVQVFSLSDLIEGKKAAIWKLVSDKDVGIKSKISPFKLFGNPWNMAYQPVRLTLWPPRLFQSATGTSDLPAELSGPLQDNVWKVSLNSLTDTHDQTPSTTVSLVELSSEANQYLANFTAINGLTLPTPSKGWLTWRQETSSLDFLLQPEANASTTNALNIDQMQDLLAKHDRVLEDQTAYQTLMPQLAVTTTSIPNLMDHNLEILLPQPAVLLESGQQSVGGKACPGKMLAYFDENSLKNICSWFDICFFDSSSLSVTQQGKNVFFCFQ